ncbi:hypothetical protein BGI30_09040 [Snodgrassella alvi]|uniref:Phage gp6-like head-tail connector protein n=3 Tax=Snodgrassella alvi TaxID=1196083 RepID=A0A855FW67_9NEIS|nr:hypothetical protein BGI30_09760 [Snodgrassella alvi]PIT08214.1 hypothetical protein BGI30_09040 [Snodgrassella alvi]PIT26718.1 hypothetical protein BGI37_05040 [Snodgrassella alvi]PIT59608.1 hypothetical protein BHC59_00535 [Snodgrassella alvi]PIT61429.1 hypothetical protein BHC57_01900 [Snodgrassella alvi]
MMISIEDIRNNCRIDDDSEDDLLRIYLAAAQDAVKQFTGRNWYENEVPDTDPTGMLYNRAVDMAMLLLTAHWYKNREAVSALNSAWLPFGWAYLLQPYQIMWGDS